MKYDQIIDHYESFKMWLEELKLLSECEWFKPMEV